MRGSTTFVLVGWSESISKMLKTDFDLLLYVVRKLLQNSTTAEIQKILTPSLVYKIERSITLLKDNQILYKFY